MFVDKVKQQYTSKDKAIHRSTEKLRKVLSQPGTLRYWLAMFKIKRALLSAAREKQTHKRIMVDQCGIALSFCPVDFYYMFLTEYHSEFNAACMQLLADALKKEGFETNIYEAYKIRGYSSAFLEIRWENEVDK